MQNSTTFGVGLDVTESSTWLATTHHRHGVSLNQYTGLLEIFLLVSIYQEQYH
jgi:hypothetical protein